MSDSTRGEGSYVTRAECTLMHQHLSEQVMETKTELEKHQIALYGNGKDGVVMQLNKLMWHSQFVDKGVSVFIAIVTSLLTFYLTKRLG